MNEDDQTEQDEHVERAERAPTTLEWFDTQPTLVKVTLIICATALVLLFFGAPGLR